MPARPCLGLGHERGRRGVAAPVGAVVHRPVATAGQLVRGPEGAAVPRLARHWLPPSYRRELDVN